MICGEPGDGVCRLHHAVEAGAAGRQADAGQRGFDFRVRRRQQDGFIATHLFHPAAADADHQGEPQSGVPLDAENVFRDRGVDHPFDQQMGDGMAAGRGLDSGGDIGGGARHVIGRGAVEPDPAELRLVGDAVAEHLHRHRIAEEIGDRRCLRRNGNRVIDRAQPGHFQKPFRFRLVQHGAGPDGAGRMQGRRGGAVFA